MKKIKASIILLILLPLAVSAEPDSTDRLSNCVLATFGCGVGLLIVGASISLYGMCNTIKSKVHRFGLVLVLMGTVVAMGRDLCPPHQHQKMEEGPVSERLTEFGETLSALFKGMSDLKNDLTSLSNNMTANRQDQATAIHNLSSKFDNMTQINRNLEDATLLLSSKFEDLNTTVNHGHEKVHGQLKDVLDAKLLKQESLSYPHSNENGFTIQDLLQTINVILCAVIFLAVFTFGMLIMKKFGSINSALKIAVQNKTNEELDARNYQDSQTTRTLINEED